MTQRLGTSDPKPVRGIILTTAIRMAAIAFRAAFGASCIIAISAIAMLAMLTITAQPANAQTACTPTINACGCVISAPGAYKIGINLDASQGLTASGSCIDVKSSYVTLDGGKKTITGSATSPPTGTGINIRKGARTVFIEGRGATITGWDVGLLVQSSGGVVDNWVTNANGTAGVELNRATNTVLSNITASSNANYGIWLLASSLNDIVSAKTETNGNIGVYVGCSPLGPIGAACKGVKVSNADWIYAGTIPGNTNYGIALDLGVSAIIVSDNTLASGAHNGKDDLLDESSTCGTNQWISNDSTAVVSPTSCVK